MSGLLERIKWVIIERTTMDARAAEELAKAVVGEIESTHRIVYPPEVTETMLDACFNALPSNYSPPDPKRRPWHAYKARHRFMAMVLAAKKLLD